jgi:AraC family L-rhamnose operon transcriptional activator RhaR
MIYCVPDHTHDTDIRLPVAADPHAVAGSIVPHEHAFIEVMFVLQGNGLHGSPFGLKPLKRGDVFVIRPGGWHSIQRPQQLVLYNCLIPFDTFHRELSGFKGNPALQRLLAPSSPLLRQQTVLESHLAPAALQECHYHLDMIFQFSRRYTERLRQFPQYIPIYRLDKLPDNEIMLDMKLTAHLLPLLELVINSFPVEEMWGEIEVTPHPSVHIALQLLTENIARPWTLTELAAQLHLDPSYLVRLFKKATGLPPIGYLSRYRAERAARLLVITDRPIATIGAEVGWPDPGYFADRFKIHYGISPRAYRTRFKQP